MKHFPPYEVAEEIWKAFGIVCKFQGITIKKGMIIAVTEYIQTHQTSQMSVDIKIVENRTQNMITFIYETNIKHLLGELIRAKQRKAPRSHINELWNKALKLVEKHPQLPKPLADEVTTVYKAMIKGE